MEAAEDCGVEERDLREQHDHQERPCSPEPLLVRARLFSALRIAPTSSVAPCAFIIMQRSLTDVPCLLHCHDLSYPSLPCRANCTAVELHNQTSDCWIDCFLRTIMAMPADAVTAPFSTAFASDDPSKGGCPTVPEPPSKQTLH